MSEIYTVIVGILGILAVSGLFVGVTNDAVNFLNSAIGSKAASMKIILTVASVGIIIGVVTSSGMMEVARSGMFNPGLFTFHEVMMLYLGVMFANVILLDLYNSWGLPTSTTVSLIFCLLGAAIAVSIYKISNDPEQSVSSLGHYINTSRAMGIVSAILLSVVIAFTCGTLVMYVSRMIFSFRYTALFRRYGSLWCGASLTAIVYFAVFKGLKSILADHAFIQLIDNHLPSAIAICWVVCSLLLFFIQRFKVNILRITILSGTFALALAFAGNDLVNFIGVPVAGFDAYTIAREAGDTQMLMGALNENVPANFLILLTAGILMILTLWTSKKAMHVSETELSLSAQDDAGQQQYAGQYAQQPAAAPMGYGPVKNDRSLIGWLLLSIVTCGIYSYYFLYCLARDINVMCQDDGDSTPGLAALILLSFVTCGFYAYYWYYKIGNRLQANAPRYGLVFQENGTTVLLWQIIGVLLCGLGPIFAMNIIIKNTNALATVYNTRLGARA